MVKRKKNLTKQIIVYILTMLFSIGFIVVGRNIAMNGYPTWDAQPEAAVQAVVRSIIKVEELDNGQEILFEAEIVKGENKGEIIEVQQGVYTNFYPVQEPVRPGDKVLIYAQQLQDGPKWTMLEYLRINSLVWLAVIFVAAVIAFGRWKGVNTMISLGFTCLAVFVVFLPSVLSGQNIYLWSMVVCVYIIVMTMLFINGTGKKSLVAGLGCLSGVVAAGVISFIMSNIMKLTGMTDESTLYLTLINVARPIDLNGIVFAAIIIGAVGAIMDVAMDIASSLYELNENVPDITPRRLISSGFNIGRDILGTMANTLVLAYIGSSLCTTLLLLAYNVSTIELFNMELIITELLQALAGSFGMLLAIPLTSMFGAAVYTRKKERENVG